MRLAPVVAGLVFLLAQQVPPVAPPTQPSFEEWLSGVRAEAITQGIREATVDARAHRPRARPDRHPARSDAGGDRPDAGSLPRTARLEEGRADGADDAAEPCGSAQRGQREIRRARRGSSCRSGGWSRTSAASAACVRRSRRWRRSPTTRGARRSSGDELFDALQDPGQRRRRAGGDARLVGRRAGPAAVHAVQLSALRAGLRRRRQARHLEVHARRLRVDRQLPLGVRLEQGTDLGPGGQSRRPRCSKGSPETRAASDRGVPGAAADDGAAAARDLEEARREDSRRRTASVGRLSRRRSCRASSGTSWCIRTTRRSSDTTASTPTASAWDFSAIARRRIRRRRPRPRRRRRRRLAARRPRASGDDARRSRHWKPCFASGWRARCRDSRRSCDSCPRRRRAPAGRRESFPATPASPPACCCSIPASAGRRSP